MLQQATATSSEIEWKHGYAESIPLDNNAANGCVAVLTIHHWRDLETGFRELFRVLHRRSRCVLFTSTSNQMRGYWLNHYFPKMLDDSMRQMPSDEIVTAAMQEAGFRNIELEPYFVQPDLKDQFLYSGKHAPERYLHETVRQGISSFSDLANADEVRRGLRLLESDIASGAIESVIRSYKNESGDYVFVAAQKP